MYCRKCENCGNYFTVSEQDIQNYNAKVEMARSLEEQANFAGFTELMQTFTGNNNLTDFDTYVRMRDMSLLKSQAKMLKNGDPFVCPHCGSSNTRFLTEKELENLKNEMQKALEDEEKRKKAFNKKINPNATVEQLKERIITFIEDEEWYEAEHYIEYTIDLAPKDFYLYYLQFLVANRCKSNNELFEKKIFFDQNNKIVDKILKYSDNGFADGIFKHNFGLSIEDKNTSIPELIHNYELASKKFESSDPLFDKFINIIINKFSNLKLDEKTCSYLDDLNKSVPNDYIINSVKDLIEQKINNYLCNENLYNISNLINGLEKLNENTIDKFDLKNLINKSFLENVNPKILCAIKNGDINALPLSFGQKFLYLGYNNPINIIKKEAKLYILSEVEKISKLQNIDNLSSNKLEEIYKQLESFNYFTKNFQLDIQKNLIEDLVFEFKNAKTYKYAIELMNKSKFYESSRIFGELGIYKDSREMLIKCNELAKYKKKKFYMRIFIPIISFVFIIVAIKIYKEHYIATQKSIANGYIANGDYIKAIEIFEKLGLSNEIENVKNEKLKNMLSEAQAKFNEGKYNESYQIHKKIFEDFDYNVVNLLKSDASKLLECNFFDEAIDAYTLIDDKRGLFLSKTKYIECKGKENLSKSYQYFLEAKRMYYDVFDHELKRKLERLYSELFPWKIEVIGVNTSEGDDLSDMNAAKLGEDVYFRIKVTGGPPDKSVKAKVDCSYDYLHAFYVGGFEAEWQKQTKEDYEYFYSGDICSIRINLFNEQYRHIDDNALTVNFKIVEDSNVFYSTPSEVSKTIGVKKEGELSSAVDIVEILKY